MPSRVRGQVQPSSNGETLRLVAGGCNANLGATAFWRLKGLAAALFQRGRAQRPLANSPDSGINESTRGQKARAMSDSRPGDNQPAKNSKPLIYVVDDEPMLLELASAILEPQGYQIQVFRDPEVALQTYTAANPRPDLLITDYAMHTMNGMELIE